MPPKPDTEKLAELLIEDRELRHAFSRGKLRKDAYFAARARLKEIPVEIDAILDAYRAHQETATKAKTNKTRATTQTG